MSNLSNTATKVQIVCASDDPVFQAQIEGLKQMTAWINSSLDNTSTDQRGEDCADL